MDKIVWHKVSKSKTIKIGKQYLLGWDSGEISTGYLLSNGYFQNSNGDMVFNMRHKVIYWAEMPKHPFGTRVKKMINEPKHTPGPWKVSRNIDGIYHGTMSVVKNSDGLEICGPRQIRKQDPNIEPNFHLIASAPELLEILEEILELFSNTPSENLIVGTFRKARALVNKIKKNKV
jgi:hypothetical protein